MAVNRILKINAEIQKALNETILFDLKNTNLEGYIISIVKVDTSNDLSHCKVYVSIFPEKDVQNTFNNLKNCIPYLRREVAKKVKMRIVPELHLFLDDSLNYSEKIDKIIDSINKEEKNNGKNGESN